MKASLLKVYYKAAAWPPFYVISLPTIILLVVQYFVREDFSMSLFSEYLVTVSFYSGLIAVSCAGLFLCTIRKIACNFLLSFLSWFLLPVSIILYIFLTRIDVGSIKREKDPEMMLVAIMAAVSMFHVIGMVISFKAFRETMTLEMKEEKQDPALREIHVRELKTMEEEQS